MTLEQSGSTPNTVVEVIIQKHPGVCLDTCSTAQIGDAP